MTLVYRDSMVLALRKGHKGPANRFTFPTNDFHLKPDVVKRLKLQSALRRVADEILEMFRSTNKGGDKIVGVKLDNIDFSFILGKEEPSGENDKMA